MEAWQRYKEKNADNSFNKVRMLINFIKITSLFSVFYILVSLMIGFYAGMYIMGCNLVIFMINLWLFEKRRISYWAAANFYVANCLFIAVLLCSFFSGGIFSPVLPWFILIPTISLLLLGICRNTLIWLGITLLVILAYGILGQLGVTYPVAYNHAFWDKIFATTCILGLALIVYLVTYIFERIKENTMLKLAAQNMEITDSIHYAKRIQTALLAPSEFITSHLPENFIFYKPKDIVSGDFYWARECDDDFYLAVCDCTGHGVPGAFMSLLSTNFLNEAVSEKGITSPDKILDFVRRRIIENTSKNGAQDGMDAIILRIHKPTGNVTFASGNGNAIIIRRNSIVKLQKDKMPVGMGVSSHGFNLFETKMQPGETMYLYTDGFPDLFGGPKGKKFTSRQFNEMLLNISDKPMPQQKEILEVRFAEWLGNLNQVDDLCVVGFRLAEILA